MEFPVRILNQTIGARIAKTGLAVFIAMSAWHWLAPVLIFLPELDRQTAFAGIAAFLAVQPSVVRSRTTMTNHILGNLLGAAIGLPLGYLLGPHPGIVALGVVLLLLIFRHLHLLDLANMAVVTLIVILAQPHADFLRVGVIRVAVVTWGTLVGLLVNRWVLRPSFAGHLAAQLHLAGEEVDRFLNHLAGCLDQPESLPKDTVKEEAGRVQKAVDQARKYLDLYTEETEPRADELTLLRHTINSLFILAEKGRDIHRADVQFGGLSREAAGKVAAALQAVAAYRGETVTWVAETLLRPATAADATATAAAADQSLSPARAALTAALDRLQSQVTIHLSQLAQQELGLVLHSIYVSLDRMAWRLDYCHGIQRQPQPDD